MKRPKSGSTVQQYAYATRRLSGKGKTKKEMALLSGYSPSTAENVSQKVEKTEGYQNAVIVLATESNNLLLAVMTEFKARGLKDFANKDLVSALNAISGAWDRIEQRRAPNKMQTPEGNRLRGVFTKKTTVETAVLESSPSEAPVSTNESQPIDAEFKEAEAIDLDF